MFFYTCGFQRGNTLADSDIRRNYVCKSYKCTTKIMLRLARHIGRALSLIFSPQNSLAKSVIRITIDLFHSTFTLADNAHYLRDFVQCVPKTLLLLWRWVSKKTRVSAFATIEAVSNHFMEAFSKSFWFVRLQNLTRLKTEADVYRAHRTFGEWTENEMVTKLGFARKFWAAMKFTFHWRNKRKLSHLGWS